MHMDKSKQRRWRFPRGKKGVAISLLSLLAVLFVILFTVDRTQLLQGRIIPSFAFGGSTGSKTEGAYLVQSHGTGMTGSIDAMADFGTRQNKAYPIPYQFLGVGGIGMGTA